MLEIELALYLAGRSTGGIRRTRRQGKAVGVQDIEEHRANIGDGVRHPKARIEGSEGIGEELRGLRPSLKDHTVRVPVERHTAGCNNVTISRANVMVNGGHGTKDVLEAEDGNFETIYWLDISGNGQIKV
jgi:hypothetical protein